MQFEKNNKYFTLCVYVVLTSIVIIIAALSIFHFNDVLIFLMSTINKVCSLLKPLIIGGIIAYLLDPIVEFYEKRCKNIQLKKIKIASFSVGKNKKTRETSETRGHLRTVPTLLTTVTLIALIGLFIMIVVMNFKNVLGPDSIQNISLSINKYISYFENMLVKLTSFTNNVGFLNGTHATEKLYSTINSFATRLSNQLLHTLTVLGANAMNILLAFVVAFYLLQDKRRVLLLVNKVIHSVLPEKVYRQVKVLGKDIDFVFSNYIRGQMIDAMIIAILTSFALTLIKMDFAIIIGMIAGIFNLIPYFGPVVGFVLAGFIGLMGGTPMKAVYGVLLLMVIQQIDGWVIVPKVVGNSVKLHPVIVLLAILIGGNLFGLIGMLLGVPVTAFIRLVILRYADELFEIKE